MSAPSTHPASVRREAASLLWLANLAFGTLLGANYLAHIPDVNTLKMWLFALGALLSSVLTLTLLPGIAFVVLAHFLKRRKTLVMVQAGFWTVFQVLLYADTRIYNIFHYHFNGQVLNLVYTRGSEDSIHLGWQVWTAVTAGLIGVSIAQMWIWRQAVKWARKRQQVAGVRFRFLRPSVVLLVVLLPAVFVEKTIYAQADLAREREITSLARIFPVYARVPMDDLASAVLGVDSEKPPRVELEGVRLAYPRETPKLDPDGARPSILVLVVDCLRRDVIDPVHTPHIDAWAQNARRFTNHVSGGNSTRYGIFSLIYSLHGSYWFPFLQERRSPVFIDTLLDEGYEMGVFSAASQNYPELRDTAWVRIPDKVHDDFAPPESWKRDLLAADAMIEWLEVQSESDDPFFGFILLDSPHQTYSYPPASAPFTPAAPEVDYLAMTANDGPPADQLVLVRNRYLNAVLHADEVAGSILHAVDRLGLGEDTLIFVTSDHGEEFGECGFFGHTSAYTAEQVGVPLLARGPGIEAGIEDRPTSHTDFAPTVLELLGADPAQRGEWSLGENFLDPPASRRRVISGWNELGVWTDDHILRVPLSVFEFDVEVYDYQWRMVTDDLPVLRAESETLERLGAECNRFLR